MTHNDHRPTAEDVLVFAALAVIAVAISGLLHATFFAA